MQRQIKNNAKIVDRLEKLEKEDVDLRAIKNEYQRLLNLNDYVDGLFKERIKEIRFTGKKK